MPSPLTPLETLTLHDDDGSRVALAPSRGAIVTRFLAGGHERLYLDEVTLLDPAQNVRGGIPVLFPSPGKLADGAYRRDGVTGAMKQHGFARNLPWNVDEVERSVARLSLASNDVTRAQFPWDFRARLEISLAAASLRLTFRVTNDGHAPLPFGFGLHPYFQVADKAGARITTAATRAFDNVRGETGPFRGFSLGEGETDLHLLDHGSTESTLTSDGRSLTVRGSKELTRWVVWTLPGKPFVCLEPWTSPGNALNSGEGLLSVEPGSTREVWVSLDAGGSSSD